MLKPLAYLVRNCPNFYFLPSLRYDRIFVIPHEIENMNMLSSDKNTHIPLFLANEEDAEYWIVNDDYAVYSEEAANSARNLGKHITPVKRRKDEG